MNLPSSSAKALAHSFEGLLRNIINLFKLIPPNVLGVKHGSAWVALPSLIIWWEGRWRRRLMGRKGKASLILNRVFAQDVMSAFRYVNSEPLRAKKKNPSSGLIQYKPRCCIKMRSNKMVAPIKRRVPTFLGYFLKATPGLIQGMILISRPPLSG